jgi:hypothetical protein
LRIITLFLFIFLFSNCTKQSPVYTVTQIDELMADVEIVPWPMAPMMEPGEAEANPEQKLLIGSRRFVNESTYGEGLHPEISARQYKAGGLVFLLVPYQTQEYARAAAQRYNQWYARNWLIDDVMGEPGLEDLVESRLNAIKTE